MTSPQLIAGLDIGTSKVAIAVGALTPENQPQLLAIASAPHSGMRRGVVTDIEETVTAISQVLEDAERMTGTPIKQVYASITGAHIESYAAKGVIAITKPGSVVDTNDVARVIETAKTSSLPQNRELLHQFSNRFFLDGQDVSRDPIGISGMRLEVDSIIVSTTSPAYRNLIKAITQADLEVADLIFGPIAIAKLLSSKKQRESGVVIVDIGAGTTDCVIFEEGQVVYAVSIPIGSQHLTHDLAICLRTSLDVAESIKRKYASCSNERVRESEQINLASLDPAESDKVSKKEVCDITEARYSELFDQIKEKLGSINRDGVLPAGVILTGGGADIDGITELGKNRLKLPVQLGYPISPFSGVVDKIDSPIYSTAIGLVLYGIENTGPGRQSWPLGVSSFGGVFENIKKYFKNFTN